jgi:hypothetical protein
MKMRPYVAYTKKLIYIFLYKSKHYSVICIFYHFYVGHMQLYFSLRIDTIKYQDNMYMQNFISIFYNFLMVFFQVLNKRM